MHGRPTDSVALNLLLENASQEMLTEMLSEMLFSPREECRFNNFRKFIYFTTPAFFGDFARHNKSCRTSCPQIGKRGLFGEQPLLETFYKRPFGTDFLLGTFYQRLLLETFCDSTGEKQEDEIFGDKISMFSSLYAKFFLRSPLFECVLFENV